MEKVRLPCNMGGEQDLGRAEYLGYKLLQELEASKGLVPRSFFFKVWCITDHYLQDEYEYASELPRYWYKYGELVDEQSIGRFYNAPSAPWGGQRYYALPDIEEEQFEVTERGKEVIQRAVGWAIHRFGKANTRQVKAHQYMVYGPNEFIRTYSELRDMLDYTDLTSQSILPQSGDETQSNTDLVENHLDQMISTYPDEEEYDFVYDLYLRWDDTARLLIEDEPQYEALFEFLDEFIGALSQCVLRFEYKSYIPSTRLDKWANDKESDRKTFETDLEETRSALLSNRETSGVLESVSEAYDQTVAAELEKAHHE